MEEFHVMRNFVESKNPETRNAQLWQTLGVQVQVYCLDLLTLIYLCQPLIDLWQPTNTGTMCGSRANARGSAGEYPCRLVRTFCGRCLLVWLC
jgi:hypothetical protein